jgi:hypothetical protein
MVAHANHRRVATVIAAIAAVVTGTLVTGPVITGAIITRTLIARPITAVVAARTLFTPIAGVAVGLAFLAGAILTHTLFTNGAGGFDHFGDGDNLNSGRFLFLATRSIVVAAVTARGAAPVPARLTSRVTARFRPTVALRTIRPF